MTAEITSLTVNGYQTTIQPNMDWAWWHEGVDRNIPLEIAISVDSGKIRVTTEEEGTFEVHDGIPFKINAWKNRVLYISVDYSAGEAHASNYYRLRFSPQYSVKEVKVTRDIPFIGWFPVICVEGNLDLYDIWGREQFEVPIPKIDPKYVISTEVSMGFTGRFDCESKVLTVYGGPKTDTRPVLDDMVHFARYKILLIGV